MAVLDRNSNEIVIRVVFDGPAGAGATSSIDALAASFGQRATPDWLEYVGGRFEGFQIRCQIVSASDPATRATQRASADAIVFVADTRAAGWSRSLAQLVALRPPRGVGVVVQANWRDAADAVDASELRAELTEARGDGGMLETVACDGSGVREVFVHAVRIALEHVRDQVARGELRLDAAADAEVDAVFDAVLAPAAEEVAAVAVAEAAPEAVPEPVVPQSSTATSLPPVVPDASVPSGAIWPPVEGRTILTEVSALQLVPRRHADGAWSAGLGSGWRLVSRREAAFDSLDAGRSALVQWARLHAACAGVVSAQRCIVLAATGDGRWRLWQIVRAEESLRERVERAADEPALDELAAELCQVARSLLDVHERLAQAPCELAVSLDSIGACDASGMYIGLMPDDPTLPSGRISAGALLEQQLGPIVSTELAGRRGDLERALDRLSANPAFETPAHVVAGLRRLLAAS